MNSLLVWASAGGGARILSVTKSVSGVVGLSKLIEKSPRRIVCVAILLVIILAFGMTRLRFDNDPEHIGIKNSPAVTAMKSLNQKLRSSGEPLQVMIKANNMAELSAAYDRLEQRISQWKTSGLISGADSLRSSCLRLRFKYILSSHSPAIQISPCFSRWLQPSVTSHSRSASRMTVGNLRIISSQVHG